MKREKEKRMKRYRKFHCGYEHMKNQLYIDEVSTSYVVVEGIYRTS